MGRRAKRAIKRLRTIRNAERAILHRVWKGVRKMSPTDLSAFIIQNAVKGALQASEHLEIKIQEDGVVIRTRKEF